MINTWKIIICICISICFSVGCDIQKIPVKNDLLRLQSGWKLVCNSGQTDQLQLPFSLYEIGLQNNWYNNINKDDNSLRCTLLDSMAEMTNEFEFAPISGKIYQLELKAVDTYSEVFLNNQLVGKCDNFHRIWRFDISEHLIKGVNKIRLVFLSPFAYNRERLLKYPYKLPSGSEVGVLNAGSFTRKPAYHFGWDWSPVLPDIGFAEATIKLCESIEVDAVNVQTSNINEEMAEMKLQIKVRSALRQTATFDFMQHNWKINLEPGDTLLSLNFTINQPLLWWCNGRQKVNLYEESLFVKSQETNIQKSVKFGVRSIKLLQEKDTIGTSYQFQLNGQRVFMKGANLIPSDLSLKNSSAARWDSILELAHAAHFNMLRVWGGGYYLPDSFYEKADELGICIWQDFMFAGSLYPFNLPDFKETTLIEAQEQVFRISAHPSCVLFCGNNEIEVAWNNWGWQQQFGYQASDSVCIWESQKEFFEKELPSVVAANCNIPYVHTSPLSNWGTPDNFNHGSMHYWGVWHGADFFEGFEHNVGRFMVEYGFQSFPDWSFLQKFWSEAAENSSHPFMASRQKSYPEKLEKFLTQYHLTAESAQLYIHNSQLLQSMALEKAIKAHRAAKHHCSGTLFWQFNDCWPGASWSVLNYDLSPKLAYHTVKKWFNPVVGWVHNGKLILVSDLTDSINVSIVIGSGKNLLQLDNVELNSSRAVIIPVKGVSDTSKVLILDEKGVTLFVNE